MAGGAEELLPRLRDDFVNRRIASGLSFLASRRAELELLDPSPKGALRLLGYLAQWVDIGFASPALIRCILARLPDRSRFSLPLIDYVHLRMAEGLVAMYGEEIDQAIRHFQLVSSLEADVADTELLAISNFWIARCLRQEGRYDDALAYAARAAQLAREAGFDKVAAVIQVLESWLVFQKGRLRDAAAILQQAETTLNSTDDYINRGNIQSAYGRMARREGRYERALDRFSRAIAEYRRQDPYHRNLARSLANIAFVKRLIAAQLQRSLDRRRALRRTGAAAPAGASIPQLRARIEEVRREAFRDLDEALEIYVKQQIRHGLAAVHINRGFVFLDRGELDLAAVEAGDAYRLAEEKTDYIQMSRARLLQCMVENARYDEQIEGAAGPGEHARLADEFARDAVELAQHTQNRRLLARAHIWRGLTVAGDFFADTETARQCCDAADALLKPDTEAHVWEDLQELKARILQRSRAGTALGDWSQALLSGKTFQQLSDDFAAIVIPKVWELENRKISRVAARLSISPKKVRRVLQAAGLISKAEAG